MMNTTPLPQTPKTGSSSPREENPSQSQEDLKELISHWTSLTFEPSLIPSLAENVASAELEKQYYGIIGLNNVIPKENEAPIIEAIVNSGVVSSMISLMKCSFQPEIKDITAACLERLCSGTVEQIQILIENGVLQQFFDLLNNETSNAKVVEASLWGLMNMSVKSVLFRDMILEQNGVEIIMKVLENFSSCILEQQVILTLAWLLTGKPEPYFPLIKDAIPLLCDYLETGTLFIVKRVILGLKNISSDGESIKFLMSLNIISKLVNYIADSEEIVTLVCLGIIFDMIIASKSEEIAEMLMEKRLLSEIFKVIDHPTDEIRIFCFAILSFFAKGTESDVGSIVGFAEKFVKAVNNEKRFKAKLMLAHCLRNLTRNCSAVQLIQCLENGIYGCLVYFLDQKNEEVLEIVLEGIERCLKRGKKLNLNDENGRNKFLVELENRGGARKIQKLLKNKRCSDQVEKIWEDHFEND